VRGYGKAVRDVLDKHGWVFHRRGKGDHDIWINPQNNHTVAVDKVIPSRHSANEVMKQAKINYKFP
jgi:predicted RNA binding protein YcfA (HicA-like mRNA interferase family)